MTPAIVAVLLLASGAKEYPDGHGGTVKFPLGDVSFADEVVTATQTKKGAAFDPAKALAAPDYDPKKDTGTFTIGCGGTAVFRFTDNALADVEGPDLYIFEVGKMIEATDLSISDDGTTWIEVGRIEGGRADVDIKPFVKPGDVFHLVKLTDLKKGCSGPYSGADVDAIGAIAAGLSISLRSEVLFDTGKSALKPDAQKELDAAAAKVAAHPGARVVVAGHTDATGTDATNMKLSEERAAAVRDYLKKAKGLESATLTTLGHGASRPIATNDTPEGREKNRRVEIVVFPKAEPSAK